MTATTVPLRAALYLRVSTARQTEHDVSIPDQKRQGEAIARHAGYNWLKPSCEAVSANAGAVLRVKRTERGRNLFPLCAFIPVARWPERFSRKLPLAQAWSGLVQKSQEQRRSDALSTINGAAR
ncbi:hypothetical protein [Shinella sp.]|uniref:hypothetical protein n=1 Tax=Shinella sp. TaxID=1870904 RepID=UPI003917DB00